MFYTARDPGAQSWNYILSKVSTLEITLGVEEAKMRALKADNIMLQATVAILEGSLNEDEAKIEALEAEHVILQGTIFNLEHSLNVTVATLESSLDEERDYSQDIQHIRKYNMV